MLRAGKWKKSRAAAEDDHAAIFGCSIGNFGFDFDFDFGTSD